LYSVEESVIVKMATCNATVIIDSTRFVFIDLQTMVTKITYFL